jgi:hypothetical protein
MYVSGRMHLTEYSHYLTVRHRPPSLCQLAQQPDAVASSADAAHRAWGIRPTANATHRARGIRSSSVW